MEHVLDQDAERVRVRLPDGAALDFRAGTPVREVAEKISPRLAKDALAAEVGGKLVDLAYELEPGAGGESGVTVKFLTSDSEEGREVLRHSTAHLMAQALKRLYPEAKLAIGPPVENGFYYDVDLETPLSSNDLARVEEEMRRVAKEDLPIRREDVSRADARALFEARGEAYKVEIIDELPPDEGTSLYRQGEFVDLCRGPHVPSTGRLKAFKLLNVAGAYWRGDAAGRQLQRVYGTAFPKKSELEAHLHMLEEAKLRDHRKLGRELGLFSTHEEGPGFPFFHPKGMAVRRVLEDLWIKEHLAHGYEEIKTPVVLSEELWRRSGHWDHYKENMYFTKIDEGDFAIKPMNCPGAILYYKDRVHSYRELPMRVAELGLVHRHEMSGVLHGLMRVRAFTLDDAHIFARPAQIKSEVKGVLALVERFYKLFGFEYHMELSTKPEKAMGSDEIWDEATDALREALEETGRPFKVNEGDGAFYGPKVDFHLKDSLGRTWQCGTVQVDFLMPERFDLTYVAEDGERHRPVMVHRAIFGSVERFLGILIEHYAGAFPMWLAPEQVRILSVSDAQVSYANGVAEKLSAAGLRVEVDGRGEKIGYKIREAQLAKVPYMLVVGEREVASGNVSVRERKEGDLGASTVEEFVARARREAEVDMSMDIDRSGAL